MGMVYCPICGASRLVYCPECGHSWSHGSGVTYCKHPPEHDGDRHLVCAGCGGRADKEGVIAPNGNLVPYPQSVIARLMAKKEAEDELRNQLE